MVRQNGNTCVMWLLWFLLNTLTGFFLILILTWYIFLMGGLMNSSSKSMFRGLVVVFDAMRHNGSPAPVFETDEGRTWFRFSLLVQPAFAQIPDNQQTVSEDDGMITQLGTLVSSLVSNLVSSEPVYKDFARI